VTIIIPRIPWPDGFPNVVVHNELRARNEHPSLGAAKAGDVDAAQTLVRDLLSNQCLDRIAKLVADRRAVIAPVAALESHGFNAIPDVMAQELADHLGAGIASYDLAAR
jgi:hypothetical protein